MSEIDHSLPVCLPDAVLSLEFAHNDLCATLNELSPLMQRLAPGWQPLADSAQLTAVCSALSAAVSLQHLDLTPHDLDDGAASALIREFLATIGFVDEDNDDAIIRWLKRLVLDTALNQAEQGDWSDVDERQARLARAVLDPIGYNYNLQ